MPGLDDMTAPAVTEEEIAIGEGRKK